MMRSRFWAGGIAAAAALAIPCAALAEVEREGEWPSNEPLVSLDLEGVPRSEALARLAKAAGWSLVLHEPKPDRVSLHVTNQPAGKVLDLLLTDGQYVAERAQSLISIKPAEQALPKAPRPPQPPAPPAAPPAPPPPSPPPRTMPDDDADSDGPDRTVTGGSLRIEKGEVVHDVAVMGGNVDVWGTVTGDLAVMGGNVRVHRGARVRGDAAAIGGMLSVETDAAIDGDVRVLGGEIHREPGARIGGEVRDGVTKVKEHHKKRAGKAKVEAQTAAAAAPSRVGALARRAAEAINGAALLFVFGAVLVALAPDRMDRLKLQIATRPMRTFATGVVSILGGAALLAALCVTVIGIPVAVVLALLGVLATIAGICSVLETVGAALLGHRTKNPYVHLAFGALLFVIATAIPHLGGVVGLVVILTAIGSVVATRAAGMMPAKLGGGSPYRDASAA